MGIAVQPAKVKLFIALLYHPDAPYLSVIQQLDDRFGSHGEAYGPLPFAWSSYYGSEMGSSLDKTYFSYSLSIDRSELPAIKIFTNSLEEATADTNGNRSVNIDPGYVSRDKVVLATTKDFYHRLYLADGIFGEVTLHYRKGKFRYFSWTYPDYRDEKVMKFLERVRSPLVKELRDSTGTQGELHCR